MLFSILFSRLSLLLFRFRLSVARLVLESVWLHNDRTFFLARIDWKLLFWYLLPPLLLLLLSNCTKSRHTQKTITNDDGRTCQQTCQAIFCPRGSVYSGKGVWVTTNAVVEGVWPLSTRDVLLSSEECHLIVWLQNCRFQFVVAIIPS